MVCRRSSSVGLGLVALRAWALVQVTAHERGARAGEGLGRLAAEYVLACALSVSGHGAMERLFVGKEVISVGCCF